MKKTGSEVEIDIYQLVKSSVLASNLNGGVFRDETRPTDSKKEDIVVIFITALDGHNQDGAVSINAYVPKINFGNSLIKNIKRCTEVERLCQTFFESLPTNNYLFTLGQLIHTFEEDAIEQHFINIKLRFKYNTLNT